MIIALIVAFVFAMACNAFDIYNTNKGLRKGVALESSTFIDWLAGTKTPKLWQLIAYDTLIRPLIFAFGFIPAGGHYPHAFAAMAIGGLIAAAVKNIKGGLAWRKLGV